ncbi:STY4528 family pathogenicity island replication protein [Ursidibacter arcticus]
MKITQPDNKRIEHGLLFFGNQHETVPTRLLHDPYLTPRAKFAWQLIKYNAREFQGGLFPSYDVLGKLLSDKPYADSRLSEKAITQTLYLLRLTRWLTLCETVRNEKGHVMGNIYLLHDEPIPILDAIQLNDEYLTFLEKCANHHDGIVNSVANHIIEHLLSDKTQWHYVSHLESMQVRYREYQQRIYSSEDQTSQQETLQNIQENILTSKMEVRNFHVEVREKSAKTLTSKMEVRGKDNAKSLILDSLPIWKSGKQYSTSTLYINKYCTGKSEELTWPVEISLSALEKNMAAQAMNGLDLGLCQAILLETQQRIIQKQDVKKPSGYLYTLIQKAHQGTFKPYYFELGQQSIEGKPDPVKSIVSANKPDILKSEQSKKISPSERERLVNQMKQLRMQLCSN